MSAQDTGHVFGNEQILNAAQSLRAQLEKSKSDGPGLAEARLDEVTFVAVRVKSGRAEVHKTSDDVFFVLSGEATLVTGGKVVNPSGDEEIRGDSIERVKSLEFDVVGNLDADVSFEPEHFEFLLGKMKETPKLGMAGAPFREGTFQYDYRFSNIENVWGGCQLFRRQCYEGIGGYMPLKGGCIDHVAVISARFHGWKTRTFPDKICMHHRTMGTAQHSELRAKFRLGVKDHSVGNHPLWEFVRAIYQMKHRPVVAGGIALWMGYAWALLRGAEVPLSKDLVTFVRREQMQRLKKAISGGSKAPAHEFPVSPTRSIP
jgi:hypothetical protein